MLVESKANPRPSVAWVILFSLGDSDSQSLTL